MVTITIIDFSEHEEIKINQIEFRMNHERKLSLKNIRKAKPTTAYYNSKAILLNMKAYEEPKFIKI